MDNATDRNPHAQKLLIQPPQGIPRDLMVGFLSRSRNAVGNLSDLLARGELESVRVFGHRLKGSGGAYGLPMLTEIGAAIERAAVAKNPGELQCLVDALEAYLSRLEVVAV